MNSQNGFSLDTLAQRLQAYQEQLNAIQGVISGQPPAAQAAPAQSITDQPATGQSALLVQLYDEFVNTGDGKQLAAGLSKFARYVQSKVDKKQDKPA